VQSIKKIADQHKVEEYDFDDINGAKNSHPNSMGREGKFSISGKLEIQK
jgi:hypothetical protein